ncbi:DUF58 domain-containing protein [uncultured Adlercreutzia sp.]|uniref:DUF58 domain-containing protein n=1 Tax=uncultured Adlercreutzia sp. TaxID=875803 RepID=UPI0025E645F7|nr:DUF58 domain-containing protein [uncultured Adlercreutzia sp.]MCI9261578.1 DUF58 domain-containing protein [Eggerthellaceae bacterium]
MGKQKAENRDVVAREARRRHRRAVAGRVALLVVAFGCCAVLPVFVNDVIGYIPLLALAAMVIVSFLYLQGLKRSLRFSEDSLQPSCERGSEIDFVVQFQNTSPLVFPRIEVFVYISDIFGAMDTVTPVSMALMPRETRDFTFAAQFDHVGFYAAGIQKIVISDLLGLFFCTIDNDHRHQVEVMPRLFDVGSLALSSTSSADSRKPFQTVVADDMDYAGVRPYEWGDPLKTIHWKLSSRLTEGDYLTRLVESYNNPGATIIIDTASPAYDAESLMDVYDGLVESALSANRYLLDQGLDATLAFVDRYHEARLLQLVHEREFTSLTDALLPIHRGAEEDALDLLENEGRSLHGQDNVVMCTARVSERLVTSLLEMRLRKKNPLLFVVVPPRLDPEDVRELTRPLRRLEGGRVPFFVISTAADLAGRTAL